MSVKWTSAPPPPPPHTHTHTHTQTLTHTKQEETIINTLKGLKHGASFAMLDLRWFPGWHSLMSIRGVLNIIRLEWKLSPRIILPSISYYPFIHRRQILSSSLSSFWQTLHEHLQPVQFLKFTEEAASAVSEQYRACCVCWSRSRLCYTSHGQTDIDTWNNSNAKLRHYNHVIANDQLPLPDSRRKGY